MNAAAPASAPKKKSILKPILIAVGVLVIIVGLGLALHAKNGAKGQSVTIEKSTVRTITELVTATGKIQPAIEVKISPEVYGEITALPFREGAPVKKGEMIVSIKPDIYQAQVEQQIAAVASSVSAAAHAQASYDKSVQDLKRYDDLYQNHVASDSDYQTYHTAADTAKADLAAAQANVRQAQGLLSQARTTLSKTIIYSPMDGTVSSRSCEVGDRVVQTGQMAGTEIMRVADLGNMEVQVNVNENDIPHVKVGDKVVISIDAYPDKKFDGLVKEIASSSENAGATAAGGSAQASGTTSDEVTNFLVRVRVADPESQLRPGMSATADIQTQTVESVVAVPIQSVTVRAEGGLTSDELEQKKAKDAQEKSGNDLTVQSEHEDARRNRTELQRVVFVKSGDHVHLAKVETGIADNTWIEIKSGVKPGEEIVSGTYAAISRTLKDGMKVFVEPPKKEAEVVN
jgi:HlyD family secretion protein